MCNRLDKLRGCVMYCDAVKSSDVLIIGLVTMFLFSSLVLPASIAAVSGKAATTNYRQSETSDCIYH